MSCDACDDAEHVNQEDASKFVSVTIEGIGPSVDGERHVHKDHSDDLMDGSISLSDLFLKD